MKRSWQILLVTSIVRPPPWEVERGRESARPRVMGTDRDLASGSNHVCEAGLQRHRFRRLTRLDTARPSGRSSRLLAPSAWDCEGGTAEGPCSCLRLRFARAPEALTWGCSRTACIAAGSRRGSRMRPHLPAAEDIDRRAAASPDRLRRRRVSSRSAATDESCAGSRACEVVDLSLPDLRYTRPGPICVSFPVLRFDEQ